MAKMRENYLQTLDGLLNAGSAGEPLQARHIPHLGGTKLQVALPAVLAPDCFHVAEIDFSEWRIRYREILSRSEAHSRHGLSLLTEADDYALSHWRSSFRQFERYHIRQTRHSQNSCTWSILDQGGNIIMRTGHRSKFMELARDCVVVYDD